LTNGFSELRLTDRSILETWQRPPRHECFLADESALPWIFESCLSASRKTLCRGFPLSIDERNDDRVARWMSNCARWSLASGWDLLGERSGRRQKQSLKSLPSRTDPVFTLAGVPAFAEVFFSVGILLLTASACWQ